MTMRTHLRSLGATLLALASLTIALPAVAQSAPSDYTNATRYDAAGRVTGTIRADPDGVGSGNPFLATRSTYDARGNLTKVETGTLSSWQSESVAPSSWGSAFTAYTTTETTYDALNRKLTDKVKGSDGVAVSLTQYSYDSVGRLECTAVRMNTAVYGSLPSSACTLGTEGSYGPDRITKNVYDAAGQLLQVRTAVGTSLESADVTYTYTNNGKQKYVIDANGNKAELRYDGFDRQVRWVFPSTTKPSSFNDSTPATAVSTAGALNEGDYELYGYDANGNRTSFRKRDGSTLTYTYDNLDRMTVKVVPSRSGLAATHTRDVYYGYDLRGLQLYARFDSASASSEGITTTYDGFGNKLTETQKMDGVTRTLSSTYDKDDRRSGLTWPDSNWVNYYGDGLDRLYYAALNTSNPLFYPPYDTAGRITALYRLVTSTGAWGWSDANSAFSYDAAGRLAWLSTSLAGSSYDGTIGLTRNPASQIVTRSNNNDAYAWTGHVNLGRAYTTNGLNQYTNVAGNSFTYDANGNLTSDGANTYVYDIENRLVSRSGGGTTATLRYDPLGRLYEVNGSATGITRFLNDGDAMVAEYNSSGTMLRRFVHGTDAGDDPLVWFEGSSVADSARRYLYADEHGSIVAVSDKDGNVLNINTYDEYGIPGSGNTGRFQYTGQAWIPELGMYYYKARIYSPTLGRFLQTDPIGYEDQYNLYAYVGNDPVNSIDPTGTSCESSTKTCKIDGFYKTDKKGNVQEVSFDQLSKSQKKAVATFNKAYTATYRDVLKTGGVAQVPNFSSDGKGGFRQTASQAASAMAARIVSGLFGQTPRDPRTVMNTSGWYSATNKRGYSRVFEGELNRAVRGVNIAPDIVHEFAFHSSREELQGGLAGPGGRLGTIDADTHQQPYQSAACQLLSSC